MAGYNGTGAGGGWIPSSPSAVASPVDVGQTVPTADTVRSVLPPAPDATVPSWLSFLRNTGAIAVIRPVQPPRRTLLGLPTSKLGAAAVAVGAVAALASHRRGHPLDVVSAADVGCSVSAFYSGAYHDTTLSAADLGAVRVAGHITMTTYADTARRLPTGFPADRSPRRLRHDCRTLAAWRVASLGVDPARLHARCAATPVLVIGSRRRFSTDVAAMETVWPQALELLDPGSHVEEWFRHPVIVANPLSPVPAWLAGCKLAAVVCDGPAAWRAPLRRAFPAAAHVLILDRSSTAAVDLVEEIIAGNPTTEPFAPTPPPGVDGWRIGERDVIAVTRLDDDEDLF